MKRFTSLTLTICLLLSALAPLAQAQFGVGAKVPPVIPPRAFASLTIADLVVVETGVLVFISGVSLDALLKLRLNFRFGGLQLRPYLGVGGAMLFLSTITGDVSGFNTQVLLGMESPLAGTRISVFGELGAAFGLSFFGNGISLAGGLGMRLDF